MADGTFNKIGTGTSQDPFRPDFSSVLGPNQVAVGVKITGETPTTFDAEYSIKDLKDGDNEFLRRRVKNSALFDDAKWALLDAAGKTDFNRTALQNLANHILRGDA